MPIKRKSSIYKKFYESIGQGVLFGHDNIHFKTVNFPKKQNFKNICQKFKIKLITNKSSILLEVIKLS